MINVYQQEIFADVLPEAMPLLEAHWQELNNTPGVPLDINLDVYAQAHSAGSLRVFTARKSSNATLIGYSAVFVHRGLHNSQQQATQDVFYVVPEQRGGMVGTRLIKFAEDELRREGVQLAYTHSNVKNSLLGRLLMLLGYEPVSITYQRRLA